MRTFSGTAVHNVRPLVSALVSVLSAQALAGLPIGGATASSPTHLAEQSRYPSTAMASSGPNGSPSNPHNILTVKNCQDDGPDSLRALISAAGEGDTIQFDAAQMQCSVITLSSVEIPIIRNDLTLQGPTIGDGKITISGKGQHRVFNHVGTGLLSISNLRIANGSAQGSGGCIRSDGSVFLSYSEVANCEAVDNNLPSVGGGLSVELDVTLVRSSISGNRVGTSMRPGSGGGVHTTHGGALLWYSSVSSNYASSQGGGLDIVGETYVLASTIENNYSNFASALWLGADTNMVNSTISSNVANFGGTAIFSRLGSLSLQGCTVTLNRDSAPHHYGAIYFSGPSPADQLTLQSSIIAGNSSGVDDVPSDIFSAPGVGVVFGAANLVSASNVWPPGVFTVTSDPRLGPLQMNGGFTRTHGLLPDSPARGVGNSNGGQSADQRGVGYPRVTGAGQNASVDIGSVQFDSIFFGGFEFTN